MDSSIGVQATRSILSGVIKQQTEDTQEWNVALVAHEVTTVVACDFKGQVGKTAPIRYTFRVTVPCIVNSKAIAAGEEVVLKRAVRSQAKAQAKPKPVRTWVEETQLRERERKRLRAQ